MCQPLIAVRSALNNRKVGSIASGARGKLTSIEPAATTSNAYHSTSRSGNLAVFDRDRSHDLVDHPVAHLGEDLRESGVDSRVLQAPVNLVEGTGQEGGGEAQSRPGPPSIAAVRWTGHETPWNATAPHTTS